MISQALIDMINAEARRKMAEYEAWHETTFSSPCNVSSRQHRAHNVQNMPIVIKDVEVLSVTTEKQLPAP